MPRGDEYYGSQVDVRRESLRVDTPPPVIIQPTTSVPSSEPTKLDHGNPLSLAFRITETVTLPSDGLSHKVTVAALEFTAALRYVCVPRQSEAVFIEANIENTSEYDLLAGPASVYMDNGFVTKTSLGVRLSVVQSRYVHL